MFLISYKYFVIADKKNFCRYALKPIEGEIERFLNHCYGPGIQKETKIFSVEETSDLGEVFELLERDRIFIEENERIEIIDSLRCGYTLGEVLGVYRFQRFLTVLTYASYPKKSFKILQEVG